MAEGITNVSINSTINQSINISEKILDVNKRTHTRDGIIDFLAGSLGGTALVYVGQPLDTVKVKMQTFPHLFTNMFDCFRQTVKVDGFRGLYAGSVPALAANITENSTLFFCYGFCQKFIQTLSKAEDVKDLTLVQNAWAGFFASFFSSVALCPTELVKCQLQAMHEVQKMEAAKGNHVPRVGPMKLIGQIFKKEGPVGFFRGLVPTLAREMPGYFFFFGGYEGMREVFTQPGQSKDDIGLLKTMVAGSIGGCAFWTLTYPVDVAKSRIQVVNVNSKDNLLKTIAKIARTEGIGALYNGLKPTLLRTVPATATLFVTYEYSKKFMHNIADAYL